MMATTWTDVAAAISASVLGRKPDADVKTSQQQLNQTTELPRGYPSAFAHSRLGPRTMAMLLGVILFTSLS